ncbi:carbohydrate kinase family protein [Granulosicoccus sp. 3-233]|uniref:carbohydrate kinase family protein n=1 Tax=Granulosicoccus sp. 3-233 TaxID=3417969 RepID=UPI003D343092
MTQLPSLGREQFAEEMSVHAGGGAFITAAYVAALGKPSCLLGRLPCAPFASIIEQEALALGVDLGQCVVASGGSPQLTVAMAMDGDRAFLTSRQGAALPDDHAARMQTLAAASTLTHLHISELSTLLENPSLLVQARQAGFSVSLDCAWDDACLDHPDIAELISRVDVFLPNESEMQRLQRNGVDSACAPMTVVKQGAAGATVHEAGRQLHAAADPCEVIDTIGAGDAFNAGFLCAWLARRPLSDCLVMGNRCGALAVGRRGGAGNLPDLNLLLVETGGNAGV